MPARKISAPSTERRAQRRADRLVRAPAVGEDDEAHPRRHQQQAAPGAVLRRDAQQLGDEGEEHQQVERHVRHARRQRAQARGRDRALGGGPEHEHAAHHDDAEVEQVALARLASRRRAGKGGKAEEQEPLAEEERGLHAVEQAAGGAVAGEAERQRAVAQQDEHVARRVQHEGERDDGPADGGGGLARAEAQQHGEHRGERGDADGGHEERHAGIAPQQRRRLRAVPHRDCDQQRRAEQQGEVPALHATLDFRTTNG
jgi:hypothetical protein